MTEGYRPRVMLLCSSRLAYPTIHELLMAQLLHAVVIPSHCHDTIEQVQQVLKGSAVGIILINKNEVESTLIETMNRHTIDLVFMISFSFKIPAPVFHFPGKGFYNVHPGPLPSYRGTDPIFHQIKNRESYAGLCIHFVDDGFDTGTIVMQEMIRLYPTDTYGKLTSRLSLLASQLVLVLIRLIMMGKKPVGKKQDDSQVNYYKKQEANDVCIYWEKMDATEIVALVNAGNPWNKGAITKLNGTIVRVVEAEIVPKPITTVSPGTVLEIDDAGLHVATIHGNVLCIRILYIEEGFYSGKYLRHIGITPGFSFCNIATDYH